jgi:surface carbohydrate biosynthesis protein
MKIIWIIDNKFRELYGLYDLKKNLSENNIKLFLFNIPIWKSAIDLINPNIVIVPNLWRNSCEPIVNYAKNKGIKIFLHSSEGMFYTDKIQKSKYSKHLIKKIDKVFTWSEKDSKFLKNNGFRNKVLNTGCLKFDKNNYLNIKKFNDSRKIKIVGIPTHMRLITGSGISRFNIPKVIRQHIDNKRFDMVGYLKFEYEYIELLTNIINKFKNHYRIILKISPFESKEIYRKTFPEIEIFREENVGNFLKQVDVVLNVYSSISVDALKYQVPVINLSKLIKWDEYILKSNLGPTINSGVNAVNLGIKAKNYTDLSNLLKKNKNELTKLCKSKNFFKKSEILAESKDTLLILTKIFLTYKKILNKRRYNYHKIFKYFFSEFRIMLFGRPKTSNYKFWNLKDKNLLFNFRIFK